MSNNISNGKILLIGTGQMSQDYVKILQALNIDFDVVGRGAQSADTFEKATGIKPFIGGVEHFLSNEAGSNYRKAIIATGTETLKDIILKLASVGIQQILAEKPGAKSIEEARELFEALKGYQTAVFIAYNRRFYSSVKQLQKIITEDGGVSSFNFEFTEWSHVITPLQKAPGVKENWLFANSTHVIDLAFFLGGEPKKMSSYTADSLEWHQVAIFAGSGISNKGALFTYQANWKAPGRWGIEILTSRHRLYLRPLEKLQIQKIGSVQVENHPLEDDLDINYKPGLFSQTQAFLFGEETELVSLADHIRNCNYYEQILDPKPM